jgi:hypothetical protein
MSLTADRRHLLAAESTARALAVFRVQLEDGKLLPVAAIPLQFVPSRLSVSHAQLLAAGHVQGLRSALLGHRRLAVDSLVAVVTSGVTEQSADSDAFAAQTLIDVKGAAVTACLFAAENVLVVGTEARGVRVCVRGTR